MRWLRLTPRAVALRRRCSGRSVPSSWPATARSRPIARDWISTARARRGGSRSPWTVDREEETVLLLGPRFTVHGPRMKERINVLRTLRALIDGNGNVRLLEPIKLSGQCQALVTILEDEAV